MSPLVRRAAIAVTAGALLSGVAFVNAQAQETTGAAPAAEAEAVPDAGTEAATLQEAASATGRFMGTAIADGRLNDPTYTNIASTEFSSVTAENVMKWESIQPNRDQYNFAGADRLMEFAAANGQQVWGHTLVWHSQLPGWVSNGGFGAEELDAIVQDHIGTVVGEYAGEIAYWDVVNEVFNDDGSLRQSVFLNTLGEEYIADAFRYAEAADPSAKLCINDYNTEHTNAKSDAMYELVSGLLDQGVPIDCVGFQMHLILDQYSASDIQSNLQRFADLGLEVVVTELDVRMDLPADQAKLEAQATQYADVVGACVAVDGCTGVTIWGFGDADSWVPGTFPGQGAALPWDDNYQPKPAYNGILEGFGATAD
ncbi:1,4-beta-xylanase [Streptomyces sp. 3MP-14]|uniref:Beta-xylanase n=1 Tax=Streptomyces mimosae TaxID=2586635 RepID=A0A5N6AP35_9ACTN|nr:MULTISPECIES: endo-1,4-beta-xylanase [Streptomyces]KAB8169863.1 1,4-beta-xylanase [Streptomyces mimosae]KAB8178611.1 1,4-beta-xylanase [Streptomyces sp. 3MP-14]